MILVTYTNPPSARVSFPSKEQAHAAHRFTDPDFSATAIQDLEYGQRLALMIHRNGVNEIAVFRRKRATLGNVVEGEFGKPKERSE